VQDVLSGTGHLPELLASARCTRHSTSGDGDSNTNGLTSNKPATPPSDLHGSQALQPPPQQQPLLQLLDKLNEENFDSYMCAEDGWVFAATPHDSPQAWLQKRLARDDVGGLTFSGLVGTSQQQEADSAVGKQDGAALADLQQQLQLAEVSAVSCLATGRDGVVAGRLVAMLHRVSGGRRCFKMHRDDVQQALQVKYTFSSFWLAECNKCCCPDADCLCGAATSGVAEEAWPDVCVHSKTGSQYLGPYS